MMPGLFCFAMILYAINPIFQIAKRTGAADRGGGRRLHRRPAAPARPAAPTDATDLAIAQSGAFAAAMVALSPSPACRGRPGPARATSAPPCSRRWRWRRCCCRCARSPPASSRSSRRSSAACWSTRRWSPVRHRLAARSARGRLRPDGRRGSGRAEAAAQQQRRPAVDVAAARRDAALRAIGGDARRRHRRRAGRTG